MIESTLQLRPPSCSTFLGASEQQLGERTQRRAWACVVHQRTLRTLLQRQHLSSQPVAQMVASQYGPDAHKGQPLCSVGRQVGRQAQREGCGLLGPVASWKGQESGLEVLGRKMSPGGAGPALVSPGGSPLTSQGHFPGKLGQFEYSTEAESAQII